MLSLPEHLLASLLLLLLRVLLQNPGPVLLACPRGKTVGRLSLDVSRRLLAARRWRASQQNALVLNQRLLNGSLALEVQFFELEEGRR